MFHKREGSTFENAILFTGLLEVLEDRYRIGPVEMLFTDELLNTVGMLCYLLGVFGAGVLALVT